MKRNYLVIALFILVVLFFSACPEDPGASNPLHGVWTYTDTDIDGSGTGQILTIEIVFTELEYEEVYHNDVYDINVLTQSVIFKRKGPYIENGNVFSITVNQVSLGQDYIDAINQSLDDASSSEDFLLSGDTYYDWDTYAFEAAKFLVEVDGATQSDADASIESSRYFDVTCVLAGSSMTFTHPSFGTPILQKQ